MLFLTLLLCSSASALPKTNLRILNGEEAKRTQFPFMVSIQIPLIFRIHHCGGSIIHKNWVLTAAHCFDEISPSRLIVQAGIVSLIDDGPCRPIKHCHIPETYQRHNFWTENDIALIEVDQPFTFSAIIKPISLGKIGCNETAVIAGWGVGSGYILHWDELTTSSESEEFCGKKGPKEEVCFLVGESKGVGRGDSGGPLVNAKGELAGVTAYGARFKGEFTNVFTRVEAHLEWINATIRKENNVIDDDEE